MESIKERQRFLSVYTVFQNYLKELGFEPYRGYARTPEDFHYSWYNEKIDDLYSVERYVNKDLDMSIRFLRDRHEHKFMMLNGQMFYLNEFKDYIKNWVKLEVLQKQAMLNKYKF